jgi:hypothetical protein
MGGHMQRDWLWAGGVWLGLSALGELVVWRADIFPGGYAAEADVSDGAFRLLMRLAVPVFALVVALLAVSVARFRSREPGEDGPPLRGSVPQPRPGSRRRRWGRANRVGLWLVIASEAFLFAAVVSSR